MAQVELNKKRVYTTGPASAKSAVRYTSRSAIFCLDVAQMNPSRSRPTNGSQGLTLVHIRAQLEQLQDTIMSQVGLYIG